MHVYLVHNFNFTELPSCHLAVQEVRYIYIQETEFWKHPVYRYTYTVPKSVLDKLPGYQQSALEYLNNVIHLLRIEDRYILFTAQRIFVELVYKDFFIECQTGIQVKYLYQYSRLTNQSFVKTVDKTIGQEFFLELTFFLQRLF